MSDLTYAEKLKVMAENGTCRFECHGCPVTNGKCADRDVLKERAKKLLKDLNTITGRETE
jgi:hypothetical protein